jgi:hypothetical protein
MFNTLNPEPFKYPPPTLCWRFKGAQKKSVTLFLVSFYDMNMKFSHLHARTFEQGEK